jgi:hypothetical protein
MRQEELWSLFPLNRNGVTSFNELIEYGFFFYGPHYHQDAYFVFVEAAESVDPVGNIDSPSGTSIRHQDLDSEGKHIRFRTSGISAPCFIDALETFTEDLTGRPSDQQRERRLRELVKYFERQPIHRIDIYVSSKDREARAISATLLPTSWNLIVLRPDRPKGEARRVLRSFETTEPDQDYSGEWLRWIGPLSPPLELRLRDIFSLNHIRDAGMGILGGEPPPGRPGDDEGGIAIGWASSEDEDWRPEGEAAGA